MEEELEKLSRKQLQNLCKKHGLKANGKTVDMIHALKELGEIGAHENEARNTNEEACSADGQEGEATMSAQESLANSPEPGHCPSDAESVEQHHNEKYSPLLKTLKAVSQSQNNETKQDQNQLEVRSSEATKSDLQDENDDTMENRTEPEEGPPAETLSSCLQPQIEQSFEYQIVGKEDLSSESGSCLQPVNNQLLQTRQQDEPSDSTNALPGKNEQLADHQVAHVSEVAPAPSPSTVLSGILKSGKHTPGNSVLSEESAAPACNTQKRLPSSSTKKPKSTAKKCPNFAKMHEKQFAKQESLTTVYKRKMDEEVRASATSAAAAAARKAVGSSSKKPRLSAGGGAAAAGAALAASGGAARRLAGGATLGVRSAGGGGGGGGQGVPRSLTSASKTPRAGPGATAAAKKAPLSAARDPRRSTGAAPSSTSKAPRSAAAAAATTPRRASAAAATKTPRRAGASAGGPSAGKKTPRPSSSSAAAAAAALPCSGGGGSGAAAAARPKSAETVASRPCAFLVKKSSKPLTMVKEFNLSSPAGKSKGFKFKPYTGKLPDCSFAAGSTVGAGPRGASAAASLFSPVRVDAAKAAAAARRPSGIRAPAAYARKSCSEAAAAPGPRKRAAAASSTITRKSVATGVDNKENTRKRENIKKPIPTNQMSKQRKVNYLKSSKQKRADNVSSRRTKATTTDAKVQRPMVL